MTEEQITDLVKHAEEMARRGVRLSPSTSAELVQAARQLRAERDARAPVRPGLIGRLVAAVVLVLVIAVALLSAGCALTPEQLRASYHMGNAADAGTTIAGLDRGCVEANPTLGPTPSAESVAGFALLHSLIYEGIYHHLKDRDRSVRLAFGRVFLVIEALAVGWNASVMAGGCGP